MLAPLHRERRPLGRWFDAAPDHPMLWEPDRTWTARELRTVVRLLRDSVALSGARSVTILAEVGKEAALVQLASQLGGARVSVFDAHTPDVSLAALLASQAPHVIVCRSDRLTRAEEIAPAGSVVVSLDDLVESALLRAPFEADPGPIEPGTGPCLVLYSSGSSGDPKGVLHSHETLAAMTATLDVLVATGPDDAFAITQSLGYVTANIVLVGAWRSGQRCAFYDLPNRGLAELPDFLIRSATTNMRTQMAVIRSLTAVAGMKRTPLRLVGVGGEPMRRDDLALFRSGFPDGCLLRASYGATEFGSAGCIWVEPNDADPDLVIFDIVDGQELRVLRGDGTYELMGHGSGELVVAGDSLTLGYLSRPDLDRTRFFEQAGRRWFRTGDLGRVVEGQRFEVLGRVDDRLKVSGNNIEPLVVERALTSIDGITAAVVLGAERPGGGSVLAAYAVTAAAPLPSVGSVRTRLRSMLPEGSVPAIIVFVDSLPSLPGGKVDRKLLSERLRDVPGSVSPADTPETTTEETVHACASQLLGLPAVGIDDDLLDLGMDSLMVAELVAALHNRDLERSITDIIGAPTIRQIAAGPRGDVGLLLQIQAGPPARLVVVVPGAGAHVSYLRPLARELAPLGRVVGVVTPDDRSIATLAALIADAVALESAGADSVIVVGHSWGGVVALEVARLLVSFDMVVERLVLLDCAAPAVVGKRRRARPSQGSEDRASEPHGLGAGGGSARELASVAGDLRFHRHRWSLADHRATRARGVSALIVHAEESAVTSPAKSWRRVVDRFDEMRVPGTHASLVAEPHVATLGVRLRAALA